MNYTGLSLQRTSSAVTNAVATSLKKGQITPPRPEFMRVRHFNRAKAMQPKGDKSHWCICDRQKVNEGAVCQTCKRRYRSKQMKHKGSNITELETNPNE